MTDNVPLLYHSFRRIFSLWPVVRPNYYVKIDKLNSQLLYWRGHSTLRPINLCRIRSRKYLSNGFFFPLDWFPKKVCRNV